MDLFFFSNFVVNKPFDIRKMKTKQIILFISVIITKFITAQTTVEVQYVNNALYAKHKVAEKETLFGISQKYGVTVDEIKKANKLTVDNVNKNAELIIPFDYKNISSNKSNVKLVIAVQKSEGITFIAKKTKVSVENIRKLNNLKNDNLSIGQKLVFGYYNETKAKTEPNTAEVKKEESKAEPKTEASKVEIKNAEPTKPIENSIRAMCLPTETKTDKNYALYNKVSAGTIITVKNVANGKTTTAKVLGKVPASVKDAELLLSGNSSEDLGVKNEKFDAVVK